MANKDTPAEAVGKRQAIKAEATFQDGEPIGTLRDFPLTAADKDCLNFGTLLKRLSSRIMKLPEDQLCDSFAVFGPWGSGKTSFLAHLRAECERPESPRTIAWINFDALKFQTEKMVLVPLLYHLASECKADEVTQFLHGLAKAGWNFLKAAIISTSPLLQKEIKKALEDLEGIPSKPLAPVELPPSRANAIRDIFTHLATAVRERHKKDWLVIAIDNLDRCRPKAALEMIEAIHLILDTPKTTFVLAMDQVACVRAIEKLYGHAHFDAALYLEKMMPDYFRIPDPWVSEEYDIEDERDAVQNLVTSLMNNKLCQPFSTHAERLWSVIGSASIMRNPRRIKRLFRRLALFDKAWWTNTDNYPWESVVFLCVISDVWPDIYRLMPIMDSEEWEKFMANAVEYKKSGLSIDEFVDEAFYEFVLAISQSTVDGDKFSNSALKKSGLLDYDRLDELRGELQGIGL